MVVIGVPMSPYRVIYIFVLDIAKMFICSPYQLTLGLPNILFVAYFAGETVY